jgi:type VI protein secretion system component Hcp
VSPVRTLAVLAVVTASLLGAATASAADDIFMVIPGVKGEVQDPRYGNSIGVDDFSWSIKVDPAGGKPGFDGFEFTKKVDASSSFFYDHAATQARISNMRIVVRKPGTKPLAYLQYCVEEATVSSYTVADGNGDENAKETVKIAPGALEMRYVRQTAAGGTLPPVFAGWSVVTNTSVGFNPSCGGTSST